MLFKITLHRVPVLFGIYCKIFALLLLQELLLSLGSLGQEFLGLTLRPDGAALLRQCMPD